MYQHTQNKKTEKNNMAQAQHIIFFYRVGTYYYLPIGKIFYFGGISAVKAFKIALIFPKIHMTAITQFGYYLYR